MVRGFSGGSGAVMALRAIIDDSAMIKACHRPGNTGMTTVASRLRGNMISRFAQLHYTIMALRTLPLYLRVFDAVNRIPIETVVALTTIVTAGNMMRRLSATRNQVATAVTGKAIYGRALKAAIDMASLTFHQTMKPLQWKPGSIVIKTSREYAHGRNDHDDDREGGQPYHQSWRPLEPGGRKAK